jgi:RHH-type proline utilization regulon transcriptional repressor/proline dehydrogenase/delta 1-pyrroline-5-carboxylate dehydrogenase
MITDSEYQIIRDRINALFRADEATCLQTLFLSAQLDAKARQNVVQRATSWIEQIRRDHKPQASATDLLSRFGLTSHEGLALMCLAEALLRIPDRATADALIRDKLGETHWNEALDKDTPWVVNAAGWALSLTGAVINLDDATLHNPGAAVGRLVSRLGQPVIREALRYAMQWLADQFVMGETIESALHRAEPEIEKGLTYSFDMLGEGARTAEDAARFYQDYVHAIKAVGELQARRRFKRPPGISVKLSALHPRYEMAQRDRVLSEMVPRLVELCDLAADHDIPLTIDAEEADRLYLAVDVARDLLCKMKPSSWQGLGFAVQAYEKRAPAVIEGFAALARAHKRRLQIRLVKGAYWDTEIKRAQERGWDDFSVYTRKASTDLSYMACARRMLELDDVIKPIFGTHNALTVAHLLELAGSPDRIEFQRLHGMGEDLSHLMQAEGLKICVYAPVGQHDVLLGYLVRRILENGANSSFVHRLLDADVPVASLVVDPVDDVKAQTSLRHPSIRRASELYMPERINSAGLDITDPFVIVPLMQSMENFYSKNYSAASVINGENKSDVSVMAAVDEAFTSAQKAFSSWNNSGVSVRAACLDKLADLLEQNRIEAMALLVSEARKTIPDALSEVREAVDFCRYYAMRARQDFAQIELPGPTGERNTLHLTGRGVFVCISPWNFPLAIFLGQIAAALVAGNTVIAKPAPQTPRIATWIAQLVHRSGVPQSAFHVLNGGTEMGTAIINHPAVAGVAFTGSTATARIINRALAAKDSPIVPLIAETGGQNAMIVDSSALPEQVIDDVITSCFRSAGQRCSALRLLCLPESTADKLIAGIRGAMRELHVGDPSKLSTDVGPVIDQAAQKRLLDHVGLLKKEATEIFTLSHGSDIIDSPYIAPQAWEIPSIEWLKGEVFGPILHIVRYKPDDLDSLIDRINATGFGLTGGFHSRIDNTVKRVEQKLAVGNFYVNRSVIGAVVGVQPFGGQGLSGTGPKAGGPHYLPRFATERVTSINTTAAGGNASLLMAASE